MGKQVFKAITAQNTFTDSLVIKGAGALTISGTFEATVTLQCSPDDGTTWVDVDTKTAAGRWVLIDPTGSLYRAGVKTGGYTSGTVNVWLKSD